MNGKTDIKFLTRKMYATLESLFLFLVKTAIKFRNLQISTFLTPTQTLIYIDFWT